MIDPSLFGKLSEMQQMAESSKRQLDELTVEGEAGNGLVTISLSGNRDLRSLKINTAHELMSKEDLEDLLSIALSRALDAANTLNEQQTLKAAQNFFPGMK
jgi:nucleoid-associated protein EbfC